MTKEIMDDYDSGFAAGKEFAQKKVLELMNEVITEYERSDTGPSNKEQVNAVKFMKSWVLSGGLTDFEGNRVCLVW